MNKLLGCLLLLGSRTALAQHTFTGRIFNDEDHQPIPGVTVSLLPLQRNTVSDSLGIFVFKNLPDGKYILRCSSIGYQNRVVHLVIPATADTVPIFLEPASETLQNVIVSTTRINQSLQNAPLTIQVISKDDIGEGTAESPSNIRELLTELSGTQMQQTSAVSGNVSIRLQGLDGRYTQLLKDGFPLYGGFSGNLSVMQTPPLDLRQVEIIKGAGSALYGGDAIAGIINLITRTPDTVRHADLILNQTLKGGSDFSGFYSKRNKKTGITVLASASRQNPYDVNKDGFTDIPRVRPLTINPSFFWYPDDSTTIRASFNLSTENRAGGDMTAVSQGADSLHPFLEKSHTDRDYYQLSLTRKLKDRRQLTIKNTAGYFYRSLQKSGHSFSGTQVSSFTEASYGFYNRIHQDIVGMNLITDHFGAGRENRDLSYSHMTFGLFAQDDWKLRKKITLETGIRADFEKTAYLLPRVALLYKYSPRLTMRLSGGTAYKIPTIFNAQSEEDGYEQVYPIASSVQNERSASANLSFHYHTRIGDDLNCTLDQNFFYTKLNHVLIPEPDSLQRGWLYYVNAPGPVIAKGFETNALFSLDELSLYLSYTYTNTQRRYEPGNPALPLTPESKFVSTLMYEDEGNWKAGIEAFYTGSQYLDDGNRTRAFWTFDAMAEKSFGHFSILANAEDFTDTRQSRFGPLYSGTIQKPVFNEIYAPLEGFVGNIAIRFSW